MTAPHPAVAARYAERGIWLRRTDLEGALRIVLPAQPGAPPRVQAHARPVRYWREPRSPP